MVTGCGESGLQGRRVTPLGRQAQTITGHNSVLTGMGTSKRNMHVCKQEQHINMLTEFRQESFVRAHTQRRTQSQTYTRCVNILATGTLSWARLISSTSLGSSHTNQLCSCVHVRERQPHTQAHKRSSNLT